MTVALFVLAAAAGAVLRHLVATGLPSGRTGVLVVNVVGSFVLGVLAGSDVSRAVLVVLGTGFCGALTTWSTFAHDVATEPDRAAATRHAALGVALGLGAAALGLAVHVVPGTS